MEVIMKRWLVGLALVVLAFQHPFGSFGSVWDLLYLVVFVVGALLIFTAPKDLKW